MVGLGLPKYLGSDIIKIRPRLERESRPMAARSLSRSAATFHASVASRRVASSYFQKKTRDSPLGLAIRWLNGVGLGLTPFCFPIRTETHLAMACRRGAALRRGFEDDLGLAAANAARLRQRILRIFRTAFVARLAYPTCVGGVRCDVHRVLHSLYRLVKI